MKGLCFGILVMWCPPPPEPVPTDSFCLAYQRVIVAKGDSAIQAPLDVKRRILANELLFKRCAKNAVK